MDERIGIIGLGIIGTAWARNYEADGVLAATWNRSPKAAAPRAVADPAAVGRACSVVQIVVADPPAVSSVLDVLEAVLGPRHLVIQSSTIDGASAQRFRERVAATGAAYLEAPFMGSLPAAEARKTIFLLGGDNVALERAEPVLARLSAARHRVGTAAQAAALKLSFNVLVGVMMEGICESLGSARRAEIPDAVYFDCLRQTALWSGLHALKEPKLRAGDFAPQFSVQHLYKDLRLAAGMVGDAALPLASVVRDRLREMEAAGLAQEDMCALIGRL